MKESYIKKYRPYDYEAIETFHEQELNYERLEQAIVNGKLKIEKLRDEKEEAAYDEWDDLLKIRKIPEGCSKKEEKRINRYNNFRRMIACIFFKSEYANYTNANRELMRMFPQAVFFFIIVALIVFGIKGSMYMHNNGFNIVIAVIVFLCIVFSLIFRIAIIELSNTENENIIERAFTNTIAIAGLIAAIIPIAIEYNKPNEDNHTYQSADSKYTFNMDQIAYIDSTANENGEYTIYFSGGLTVTVPQQVYDEVYAALNK